MSTLYAQPPVHACSLALFASRHHSSNYLSWCHAIRIRAAETGDTVCRWRGIWKEATQNGTGRHLYYQCRDAWRAAPQPIVAYPAGCVPVLVIHCDWACRRCSVPGAGNDTVSLRCNVDNFRVSHITAPYLVRHSRRHCTIRPEIPEFWSRRFLHILDLPTRARPAEL